MLLWNIGLMVECYALEHSIKTIITFHSQSVFQAWVLSGTHTLYWLKVHFACVLSPNIYRHTF